MFLLAFLIYNDGIQTIIRMATIYGTEIGLDDNAMIGALLVTQFIGIPFAFLFGMFADRVGAKAAIFLGLVVYSCISVLGYFMHSSTQFFALAILVGMVQGGTQALSRSLFASMIPRHKSSEFFAFFSVFERYAGILGPAIFAWVVDRSGSSRNAIISVLAFFVVGAALLSLVDVAVGTPGGPAGGSGLAPASCPRRRPQSSRLLRASGDQLGSVGPRSNARARTRGRRPARLKTEDPGPRTGVAARRDLRAAHDGPRLR